MIDAALGFVPEGGNPDTHSMKRDRYGGRSTKTATHGVLCVDWSSLILARKHLSWSLENPSPPSAMLRSIV